MQHVTRTIYGAAVQASLFTGTPCLYPEYSTLNKALNIRANQPPSAEARPNLSFYVWGNRGHTHVHLGEFGTVTDVVQHRATDAGLYNMLPHVLREVNNDLNASERNNYVLRCFEEHNGVAYVAYYGRRLNKTNLQPSMQYTQVVDGNPTVTDFIPTANNLKPTPPTSTPTGLNHITADYVSARARLTLDISEREIAEMLNVAKVIYDDERLAIISEIGMCTGVDLTIQAQGYGGSTFNFTESIGSQIATHIATYINLSNTTAGYALELDIGANEPLFSLSPTDGSITLTANKGK